MHTRAILAGALLCASALHAQPQPESQPVPLPDYTQQYHDYARSLQPDGANGWDLLVQIADLHHEIAERHYDPDYTYHDDGMVDYTLLWEPDSLTDDYTIESQLPRIHAQIQDARGSGLLDLLDQLAATDRITKPAETDSLLNLSLPHLGWSRAIARLNGARMMIAAQQDNPEELAAACGQNLWLSRAIPRSAPVLIGNLVGIAIEALTLERSRDLIIAGKIDTELAQSLLAAIDNAPAPLTMPETLRAEQLMRLDTFNRLYTDDGRGDGRFVSDRLDILRAGPPEEPERFTAPAPGDGSRSFVGKARLLERDAEVQRALLAIAATSPQDRAALADPFEAEFEKQQLFSPRGQANMLIGIMLPAVDRAIQTHDQVELMRAATKLMLAIEIYRAREGGPPAQLADLSPGILAQIPNDPYTRKPLIYAPESESPLGYRLHSAGFDMTDNGGSPDPDYVYNALRPDHDGTDFPFVPPADE